MNKRLSTTRTRTEMRKTRFFCPFGRRGERYGDVEWLEVNETEWYSRGYGTVFFRNHEGWYGSNSVRAMLIEPHVGPFKTREEAIRSHILAVEQWRRGWEVRAAKRKELFETLCTELVPRLVRWKFRDDDHPDHFATFRKDLRLVVDRCHTTDPYHLAREFEYLGHVGDFALVKLLEQFGSRIEGYKAALQNGHE